jgi:hypothetical protein
MRLDARSIFTDVKQLVASGVSKICLAQARVATQSLYWASKRTAAGPRAENGGAVPVAASFCVTILAKSSCSRRPQYCGFSSAQPG